MAEQVKQQAECERRSMSALIRKQIEQRVEQSIRDFVAAHYAELLEAVEPEAEAAVAELQRRGQEFRAAAGVPLPRPPDRRLAGRGLRARGSSRMARRIERKPIFGLARRSARSSPPNRV
jgi:hypothetical protein